MFRPALALIAVVTVVGLGACDAEVSQDPDPAPPSEDVVAGLAELYAGSDPTETKDEEARCFAEALTERLSIDQLREAGLVEDNGEVTVSAPMLDLDTAGAWVDAQASCVPFVEVSTRALATQTKGKLDEAAYTTCFTETITEDEVRAALVATLTGDFGGPEVAVLSRTQGACAKQALPSD